METKTVNFYGEMFKLNKINDELWISEPTDQEECLVFELCDGTWYRSFYTTDEIESEFNQTRKRKFHQSSLLCYCKDL